MEIHERIKNVIIKTSKNDVRAIEFDNNLNLIDSGLFDSLGFLELISKLEDEFSIEIDLSEENPKDFTNYKGLSEIILRYEIEL